MSREVERPRKWNVLMTVSMIILTREREREREMEGEKRIDSGRSEYVWKDVWEMELKK